MHLFDAIVCKYVPLCTYVWLDERDTKVSIEVVNAGALHPRLYIEHLSIKCFRLHVNEECRISTIIKLNRGGNRNSRLQLNTDFHSMIMQRITADGLQAFCPHVASEIQFQFEKI